MQKLLAIVLFFSPLSVFAQDQELQPPERFALRLGGLYMFNADTEIRLDRSDGLLGSSIDLERDLDMDTSTSGGRADATWRFARNHSVELGYYRLKREGSRPIDRDLTIGDTTYTANTTLDSTYQLDVARLEYLYSFYWNEKVDLAFGLGAYGLRNDITFSTPSGIAPSVSRSADVPLPVVSFRLDYHVTPKTRVLTAFDQFFINQNDVEGSLSDFRVLLERQLAQHFGVGIGFDRFALDASLTGSDWDGSVTANWNTGLLYITLTY